ncbi:MAG: CRISPR-associated endonuclease Cas2 [Thermodesulfobacteriota bacterium]
MFYLVCFDIVDDRVRYRAVKILKQYGFRVQKSVFECPDLTEKQFIRLKMRLEACIDVTQDSVRYYYLSKDCLWRAECSGIGEPPRTEIFRLI